MIKIVLLIIGMFLWIFNMNSFRDMYDVSKKWNRRLCVVGLILIIISVLLHILE